MARLFVEAIGRILHSGNVKNSFHFDGDPQGQ
jgi:hypothetical protein